MSKCIVEVERIRVEKWDRVVVNNEYSMPYELWLNLAGMALEDRKVRVCAVTVETIKVIKKRKKGWTAT